MSRLTIDISDQQHKILKTLAALQGKTIRQYAIERLFPSRDGEEQAWSELKTFLQDRIRTAGNGGVSEQSFDDIVVQEMARGPAEP